jgi:MEDS: MEthanogen/methylotroph, DcmR Sensory domain
MPQTLSSPAVPSRHAVQFYGNEASLCATVGAFLGEGFIQGQPAIVIATAPHTAGIVQELSARMIDVDSARRLGDLILLDAEDTLATFMVNDLPDPALFARHVGAVMEQALGGRTRTPVRAYGEMVDLLWREGRADSAIRLEILWNELATTRSFSLLCGYSMGNFYKQTRQFQEICAQHTHVLGADSQSVPFERRNQVDK